MLSYRHAFHAGNHADVLKHLCQVLILDYLVDKPGKRLRYIDTHAGCGEYRLDAGYALQNSEFESGIARLWEAKALPEPLARYVEVVRNHNPRTHLSRYPGSAVIAAQILRPDDRLQLFELHPTDFSTLDRWASADRRIEASQQDGLARLGPVLPPPERRALTLIDPSYEIKNDYRVVVSSLKLALKHFATGVFLIWYPLLARHDLKRMQSQLAALPVPTLTAELSLSNTPQSGMAGSGVCVVNPPWQLHKQLQLCSQPLTQLLGHDASATLRLTSNNSR